MYWEKGIGRKVLTDVLGERYWEKGTGRKVLTDVLGAVLSFLRMRFSVLFNLFFLTVLTSIFGYTSKNIKTKALIKTLKQLQKNGIITIVLDNR